MEDPVALVRAIYAAGESGDVSSVLDLCAEDVIVDQDPRLPWGGHYVGRDGVMDFFVSLTTHVDTTIETDQLFRAGDDVVQHGRSRGTVRSSGAPIDVAECHIWRVRGGVIEAVRFYIESDPVLAALGLDEPAAT